MSTRTPLEEGVRLAQLLGARRDQQPFVLGIARGGVLAANAIARELRAPLDVLIAGKVLAPGGVAVAGIAEGDAMVADDDALDRLHLTLGDVDPLVEAERARLERAVEQIRGSWPLPVLTGRTVILVDDAVVTGLTMRAAIAAVLARRARRVVVATPLCSAEACQRLGTDHDVVRLASLPMAEAARLHAERIRPGPALGDAEIHDLVARELRDLGPDPFDGQAIDAI